MKTLLNDLSLDELQKLFREKEDKLANTLLSGVEWKNTVKERQLLTSIAAAIYKKVFPAEPFNYKEFKYYVKDGELENVDFSLSSLSNTQKSSIAIVPKTLFRSGLYTFNFLISLVLYCLMQVSFFVYSTTRLFKKKINKPTLSLFFVKGQLFYTEMEIFVPDLV